MLLLLLLIFNVRKSCLGCRIIVGNVSYQFWGLGLSKLGFWSENRGLFVDLSVIARHDEGSNPPSEQMSTLAITPTLIIYLF